MVDTTALRAVGRNPLKVQVLPLALITFIRKDDIMWGDRKGKKHNTIKIHANSTANKLRHRSDDLKGITSYNIRGTMGPVCPQNPPRPIIKRYLLRDISDEYTIAKLYRMQISNLEGMWGTKEVIEKLVELEAQSYKAAKELEVIVKNISD